MRKAIEDPQAGAKLPFPIFRRAVGAGDLTFTGPYSRSTGPE